MASEQTQNRIKIQSRNMPSLLTLVTLLATAATYPSLVAADDLDLAAAYYFDGVTVSYENENFIATGTNESVVLLTDSATVTLTNTLIFKTGDTTSNDDSSFYNLNAAVAVQSSGNNTVIMNGCTIATDGEGANGLHTYGDDAAAYAYDLTVATFGSASHGIYTAGGYIYANNLIISINDESSSAIATDRGGGTILVEKALVHTLGIHSALVYSTGNITATDLTGTTATAPAGVIDGNNSFALINPNISSTVPAGAGVFQIFSSGENDSTGTVTVTGGLIEELGGEVPFIFTSNAASEVYLLPGSSGLEIDIASGIFVNASAGGFGTDGENGGDATVYLEGVSITGDVYCDNISSVALEVSSGAVYSGAIDTADICSWTSLWLAAGTTWNVTGDSYLDTLSGTGTVIDNGYTVVYSNSTKRV